MKKIYFSLFALSVFSFVSSAFSQSNRASVIQIDSFRLVGTQTGEIQVFDTSQSNKFPERPVKTIFLGNHAITALALTHDSQFLAIGTQDGFLFSLFSPLSQKTSTPILKAKLGKPIAILQFPQTTNSTLLVETLEPNEGRDAVLVSFLTPGTITSPIHFVFKDHQRDLSKTWFVAYWYQDQVKILLPEEFSLNDFLLCPVTLKNRTELTAICHQEHIPSS